MQKLDGEPPPPPDDREWVEIDITQFGDPEPKHILVPGRCRHTRRVPVDSVVTDETVAQLCLSCDQQLPVGWVSPYDLPAPDLEWREMP